DGLSGSCPRLTQLASPTQEVLLAVAKIEQVRRDRAGKPLGLRSIRPVRGLCPPFEVADPSMIDNLSEAAARSAGIRQTLVEKLSQLSPQLPLAQAHVGTGDGPKLTALPVSGGRGEYPESFPSAGLPQLLKRENRTDAPEPPWPWDWARGE